MISHDDQREFPLKGILVNNSFLIGFVLLLINFSYNIIIISHIRQLQGNMKIIIPFSGEIMNAENALTTKYQI